ncbi:MAG TPA: hypothetical protein VFA62_04850 [Acidimicrobiia bacterium]|nr:hypothetical protein [Acidimicrobiia bacterium]
MPNWAEQVTAIATVVSAVGWLSAIGAALFAAQQVREARHTRQAQVGADFVRRWDETPLVESRRLVAGFATKEELKAAFLQYVDANAAEAYVLYRELDYFEQLGALERVGAVNFELVKLLLGRRLIERWEMWKPSIDGLGDDVYPMFEALVAKMRTALTA